MVSTGAFAATEIGAVAGTFAVSPSGAATYSIPITLPPGVAGLTPRLALTYSSQMRNGLAGFGWTLSGLSAVTACKRTWAQDGANLPVSFASGNPYPNKFCLDGSRLVLAAGTYGSPGSTYRKELDDFAQITAATAGGAGPVPTSGPQWFKVQTGDGLTYEYGKTADSEIVATGRGIDSAVTMVRAWALDRVYDSYGNAISFTYQQDASDGDYWPTQITYTDHNGTSGPHAVLFQYTNLASISPGLVWNSYEAGALISQTRRLSEIDVQYEGSTTFRYSLAYQNTLTDGSGNPGTERSRLTTIRECAGSTCYPTTTIGWQNGTSGWGTANSTAATGLTNLTAAYIQLIDVNGDGRADLVYPGATNWVIAFANGSNFDAPYDTGVPVGNYKQALSMNIDGSGRTGLIEPNGNGNVAPLVIPVSQGATWQVLLPVVDSASPGGYTFQTTALQDKLSGNPIPATGAGGNATVVDANGDGLSDVLFSNGTNLGWLQNVGGSDTARVLADGGALGPGAFSSSGDDFVHVQSSFAGGAPDFDGSGRGAFMTYLLTTPISHCTPDDCPPPQAPYPEWNAWQGGGNWAYVRGQLTLTPPTLVGSFFGDGGDLVVPMPLDLNGDGISDFLYAPYTAPNETEDNWYVYESTGTSFTASDTGIPFDSRAMRDALGVDYSGNGREQVLFAIYQGNACTDLVLVGFAGGVFHGNQSAGASSEGPCASGYYAGSFRAADINGDGLMDLIWVANGTVNYALHSGVHPDLVTQISNGFNQTYTISYAPLSNGASYLITNPTSIPRRTYLAVGGTASVPEARNYNGAAYVVTGYTSSDGVGGSINDSFSYQGALLDTLGRGFLGFYKVTATDAPQNVSPDSITATATYNQLFPLTGDVASSVVTAAGHTQQQATTSWSSPSTVRGARYVYAARITHRDYELGARSAYRVTTTTAKPTLGSRVLTRQVVKVTTSPTTVTSTTTTDYQADTGTWCLILPSSVTIERVGINANNQAGASDITRTVTYPANNLQTCRATQKSVSVTDGSDAQSLETAFTYDDYGNLGTQTVTAASTESGTHAYQTQYQYDPTNTFVASVTNALNGSSTAQWNPALGVELSGTDPNNVTTSVGHDPFGLKTDETLGDGTSIHWSYCLPANGCSVNGGAYSITATHLSSNGGEGRSVATVYDSFGRPVLT